MAFRSIPLRVHPFHSILYGLENLCAEEFYPVININRKGSRPSKVSWSGQRDLNHIIPSPIRLWVLSHRFPLSGYPPSYAAREMGTPFRPLCRGLQII